MGRPSVFPTGVTIYKKDKAYNGYTLYPSGYGATLVDMNGRVKKIWKGVVNPIKPLPDGQILGVMGVVPGFPGNASHVNAVQVDWEGHIVWKYNNNRKVVLADGTECMAACVHHDFERSGMFACYYTPDMKIDYKNQNALLLTHNPITDSNISSKQLLDERIIEVDGDSKIVWEWSAYEHFDEFGLDEDARKSIHNYPALNGDWIHLNAVSALGENVHWKSGDARFAPDNIICSSRQLNIIFIIDKKTKKIVWKMGPDYLETPELKQIGQIIGQHHVHMIPEGLPGAGNILIFDNGGFGGFGVPTGCAPIGVDVMRRHYSRVLEINPVTLTLQWEYVKTFRNQNNVVELNAHQFFSPYISSVQRLPNGNTLIAQGADGIIIEVTPEKEIVWEYVNPVANPKSPELMKYNIYRAYRVPYHWVPQLDIPDEVDVLPPDNIHFRVPGSCDFGNPEMVLTDIEC